MGEWAADAKIHLNSVPHRDPWLPGSTISCDRRGLGEAVGISRISPDGRRLGIYRAYGSVLSLYQLPGLQSVASLGHIAGFNFSPRQDEIAITSRGHIEFWGTATWQRTRVGTNFIGLPYIGMLYARDGRSVWLLNDFPSAGLYDARTLEPRLPLPSGMLPLSLGADDRYLAVSVDAQRLQVWDLVAVRNELRKLGLDWRDDEEEEGKVETVSQSGDFL